MKKQLLAAVLNLCALTVTVSAADIVATDGTVYRDINIQESTPLGINFSSEGNVHWLDFRDMPPETAARYGYDPAKAAAFEKQLAASQQITTVNNSAAAATTPTPATTAPAASTTTSSTTRQSTTTVVTPIGGYSTSPSGTTVVTPLGIYSESTAPASPPPATQVVVVTPDTPVIYDPTIVYEPGAAVWVLWNGRYYPRYWWHYWYWNKRWVMWNGRCYPAHYFYGGGRWHGNHYYRYHHDQRHNLPPRHGQPGPDRRSPGMNPSQRQHGGDGRQASPGMNQGQQQRGGDGRQASPDMNQGQQQRGGDGRQSSTGMNQGRQPVNEGGGQNERGGDGRTYGGHGRGR